MEDDATILNFYNKYGDIGLLSHKIKSFITASRWLPTQELSSKSSVLSITPYQSEYFFETNWKKRLKAVSSPIVVDKQRFPDVGKDNDFGVGEYNNEMKKLLGTLVKDPTERLVGQIPKLIFEDHLEFSQFKFNKDFDATLPKSKRILGLIIEICSSTYGRKRLISFSVGVLLFVGLHGIIFVI